MLKIIRSGFRGGAHARIVSEICRLAEEKKRIYLIVPEQQTVTAESEMAGALPKDAPLYFEATNFTRFANTVFRALGGISGEYCTKTKKALIMWRALEELAPTLNMTAGYREVGAGQVQRMLSAIGELQSKGITAEELELFASRADTLTDSRLSDKLRDLSRVYSLYRSKLLEKYSDTGDDGLMMAKRLLEFPDFLSGAHIYIDGFTSFTEPQYRALEILMKRCELTVSLCIPKGADTFFEYRETADTERRLIGAARLASCELKRFTESDNLAVRADSLAAATTQMWRLFPNNANISLQNEEEIRIIEARTPFDECDFLASDIKRRVMLGDRYSDFAVVARSSDKYEGILDSALAAAGIPHFTSYKRDISSFEAIKLIYSAYGAVRSGFAREDVLTYAKCGHSGISPDERDELEMYVNKWQISGRRFTDGLLWNMSPAGYDASRDDSAPEKLLRINKTKTKLITPLESFSSDVKAARTVRAHAAALMRFLLSVGLEESLERHSQGLALIGEANAAEENSRLWDLICDSLDELVEIGGDFPASAESFLGQLKTVFSSADIGRIPAFCDEVTVGNADMLRLSGKKHVYLLGVNAGEFPGSPADGGFFTDKDKAALSAIGIAMEDEGETVSARELYYFTRAFSYADETVTLIYSSCDARFKSIERAGIVDKLLKLVSGLEVTKPSTDAIASAWTSEGALMRLSETDESDRESVRAALVASGMGDMLAVAESEITNNSLGLRDAAPYSDGRPIALTQSRLDSFSGCPLEHFCRYTVRLSEEEIAEFNASSIGTFIHAILENFFKALRESGKGAGELSAAERAELTAEAAQKYVSEMGEDTKNASPRLKIKLERLCRAARPVVDGLCEEFSSSKYEPRFFELAISKDGKDGPRPVTISSEGGDIFIYGIIDRVDTYKKDDDVYVRVIDYNTGRKDFSPEDLGEGKNLQMFLYLRALTESREFADTLGITGGGKAIPAGVIYVKTHIGDTKVKTPDDAAAETAVKEAQSREGMLLSDEESISAMDIRYTPISSKAADGTARKDADKFLYTAEGWEELSRTVEESVKRIADGIRSGTASATPRVEPDGSTKCEYCKFKPICRKPEIK